MSHKRRESDIRTLNNATQSTPLTHVNKHSSSHHQFSKKRPIVMAKLNVIPQQWLKTQWARKYGRRRE